jgi:hypothetical protein
MYRTNGKDAAPGGHANLILLSITKSIFNGEYLFLPGGPLFMGLALHWFLVLLYKVGLGFITRFFYRSVFISNDTLFHQDILWNKHRSGLCSHCCPANDHSQTVVFILMML